MRGQLKVVVSLPDQRMDVYDGTIRVASSRISSGKAGHRTPRGIFSIIQKNRRHFSNIYNNAPMPYMQRLTWSGIALHAGAVPRYPASHGCVRMPHSFARKLFSMTTSHAHVVVNAGRQRPEVVVHDTLFQPRPRHVVNHAAAVQAMTLDGLTAEKLSGRDMMRLRTQQADVFADHLKTAHHPNFGARPRAHIILTQRLLGILNGDVRRPDGDLGPITRRAIRTFQRRVGMKPTGRISTALTRRLYHEVGLSLIDMDAARADEFLTPVGAEEPLRILITRHKEGDNVKLAQKMLADLGYPVGPVDAALGPGTRAAIVDFRLESGMSDVSERAARVDDELMTALYAASGEKPAETNGKIMIRQGYRDIYEAPITITGGDAPLGTHLFTSVGLSDDRTVDIDWVGLSVAEGNRRIRRKKKRRSRRVASRGKALPFRQYDAQAALERIIIPASVRAEIERRLTPNSSIIVSDYGSSHETGEGTDHIVLTR
ncbi:MAG: L,D-transpeptidase family protein [Pseudomonadota bacterium]